MPDLFHIHTCFQCFTAFWELALELGTPLPSSEGQLHVALPSILSGRRPLLASYQYLKGNMQMPRVTCTSICMFRVVVQGLFDGQCPLLGPKNPCFTGH